ncbi:hypothetical protein [Rhodohalobacter sp. 8-1]|uniref:hypothetical protein n=1 Tax=Rhodohalobacter sp. 8-1 TaxID=3131972 RepID=UPI0030EB9487
MDIFKLIFEHDLRLDQLKERHTDRNTQDVSSSLEDFLKPDLTYSKFYITGTRLDEERFGLNTLSAYDDIIRHLSSTLADYRVFTGEGYKNLESAIDNSNIGEPIILSKYDSITWDLPQLTIDSSSNAGHKKEFIAALLKTDDLLIYKEQAHHGFDLHLFSKDNIYRDLFYPLKSLVGDQFRFFSINGKRIRSERKFYFETWTLDNPPHGAEEVFEETVL